MIFGWGIEFIGSTVIVKNIKIIHCPNEIMGDRISKKFEDQVFVANNISLEYFVPLERAINIPKI
jgi:hypothetical protein